MQTRPTPAATFEIRRLTPLFQVFDMPASLDFYRRVLGFDIVQTAGPSEDIGFALLRRDGIELMLNTAFEAPDRPPSPATARQAAHGDTALYLACPDVDAAYAHFRALGIHVREPAVAHYGMKQLYVSDPDGYALCFQWPVDEEPA